jgi:hypothetical protein
MALEKIMPDDMNEVMCALLKYVTEDEKAQACKMSYGDFGKLLANNHGKRRHGGYINHCQISSDPDRINIETCEETAYSLTWNKIAKFIHPYLKSTAVSETEDGVIHRAKSPESSSVV